MEGQGAVAILLLLALAIGGVVMIFNGTESWFNIELGIGFEDIKGISSGIWIILARVIVGPILIVLSLYAIWNILKG